MKKTFNKKFIIKSLSVVLLCLILVFSTHEFDNYKKNIDNNSIRNTEIAYMGQNMAFTGFWVSGYLPYALIDKSILSRNLEKYQKDTNNIVTENDVEDFLLYERLPNGQPKTYKNAGNKKIYDFVMWRHTWA